MKNARKMIKGTLSVILVLSMMLAILTLAVAAEDTAQAEGGETITIVVATADIPHGNKITKNLVTLKEVKNVNIPSNVITDPAEVIGRYVNGVIYEGEYIYKDKTSKTKKVESNTGLLLQPLGKCQDSYLNIGDYIPKNSGKDVTTIIQGLIDKNFWRTIYFPDGEYIISRPICTPGTPSMSVSIMLSDGAVIKASDKWQPTAENTAMIAIGGSLQENTHQPVGSYYSFQGGTLDGGTKNAKAISIDSGRETLIKNVHIVNSSLGLEIKKHPNYGSTDADIEDITIVGTGKAGSIGFQVVGFDCTATSIKVYDCQIGAKIDGGGTLMKNIECYYTHSSKLDKLDAVYGETVGILEGENSGNWYYDCYVENYATAFKLHGGLSVVDRCHAKWTSSEGGTQTMFHVIRSDMALILGNCKAEFFDKTSTNAFLLGGSSGPGGIEAPMVNMNLITNSGDNLKGRLISEGAVIPIS